MIGSIKKRCERSVWMRLFLIAQQRLEEQESSEQEHRGGGDDGIAGLRSGSSRGSASLWRSDWGRSGQRAYQRRARNARTVLNGSIRGEGLGSVDLLALVGGTALAVVKSERGKSGFRHGFDCT